MPTYRPLTTSPPPLVSDHVRTAGTPALAVFKGADHCILASQRIPSRLISAGQQHDGVSPRPCGFLRITARVFSKCSTSRGRMSPTLGQTKSL